MRRTVATILVVASPLLLATPVRATDQPVTGPQAAAVAPAALTAPVLAATPAPNPAPAPVTLPAGVQAAVPAAPAPHVATPAAPAPVRHAVKPVHPKMAAGADLSDAAYASRLQAELCMARQIFCGLDHNGRYPGN